LNAAFLFLWGAYTLYALYRNVCGRDDFSFPLQLMQTLLTGFALYWMFTNGKLTRTLWSPLDVGAGLLAGHLLFILALSITHQHPGDVAWHAMDLRGMAAYLFQAPETALRFLGIAAIEELVFRGTAQEMLLALWGSPVPAIGLTALCFCLLHGHFFRKGFTSALEFALFSLLIGIVYYYTSSLTLVILAHTVRNVESVYLENVVSLEDTVTKPESGTCQTCPPPLR